MPSKIKAGIPLCNVLQYNQLALCSSVFCQETMNQKQCTQTQTCTAKSIFQKTDNQLMHFIVESFQCKWGKKSSAFNRKLNQNVLLMLNPIPNQLLYF